MSHKSQFYYPIIHLFTLQLAPRCSKEAREIQPCVQDTVPQDAEFGGKAFSLLQGIVCALWGSASLQADHDRPLVNPIKKHGFQAVTTGKVRRKVVMFSFVFLHICKPLLGMEAVLGGRQDFPVWVCITQINLCLDNKAIFKFQIQM